MGNKPEEKELIVLFADDDFDDRTLLKEAFEESRVPVRLYFVDDGEELVNYLQREGKYGGPEEVPFPDIVLLDLNMPRRNGWWALKKMKEDTELCRLPMIILTTSAEEEDIIRSYKMGASSFITKPASFEKLQEVVRQLEKYWFHTVELPGKAKR